MTGPPLLSPETLTELQQLNERDLPHVAALRYPVTTTASGGRLVTTYPTDPDASYPCRASAVGRQATLEQLIAGAPTVPQVYEVAFAAGTVVRSDARLTVTGTTRRSDGSRLAFTLTLAVQGGDAIVADAAMTLVTAVPVSPTALVETVVPQTATITLSATSVAAIDAPAPTASVVVGPAGAPQAGTWGSTNPAVATVDAVTGVVTLTGTAAGTFALTFTPAGHPEAMGTSDPVTVAWGLATVTITSPSEGATLAASPTTTQATAEARTALGTLLPAATLTYAAVSGSPAAATITTAGLITPSDVGGAFRFAATATLGGVTVTSATRTTTVTAHTADLSYTPTLFWDTVATPGRPANAIAHRYPIRRLGAPRKVFVPRTGDRWGIAAPTGTEVPAWDTAAVNQVGATAVTTNTVTDSLTFFPELGGMAQPAGQYVPTEIVAHTARIQFPSTANSTAWVSMAIPATAPADTTAGRAWQDLVFLVPRARLSGQVGKRFRVAVEQQIGSVYGARAWGGGREVTLGTADQFVVLRVPVAATGLIVVRAHEDLSVRAIDFDLGAMVNQRTSLWGDPRHVPVSEWPTHAQYGLMHQWPTRNSWLNSDDPTSPDGATVTTSTTPAPDDDVEGVRRYLRTVTLPAGSTLRGPAADVQTGTGNTDWTTEIANNTGNPPNFVWVGVYADPSVAGKLEGYLLYPDASESAHVALADYDTTMLADPATGRRFYRARITVNTAGQAAKTLTPVIKNVSGAALGPVAMYRWHAISEQLNESRTQGWHSCFTPPASGATTPAVSDMVYATVNQPDYLTRAQGVIGLRIVLPFDLYDIAVRGGKFDLWQAGILGSPADLGSSASCYRVSNGAGGYNVRVQVNSNTNVLNDGSPNTGGGGMSFSFDITGPGVWPAWTPIDFAWRWANYGNAAADPANNEFLIGVGSGPTQWFRAGSTMPAGYVLSSAPSGAQGTSGWDFSGPFCFGSDIDLTGMNGGFSQGWLLGKTLATRAQVEGQFTRLAGSRTAFPALRTPVSLAVPPAPVILVAGSGAQRIGVDKSGVTGLPVRALDANGDAIPAHRPTYTSSAPAVVTVDGEGYVTPVAAGTATVTASVPGSTVSAAIPVVVTTGQTFTADFSQATEADWWLPVGAIPSDLTVTPASTLATLANGKDNFSGQQRRGYARAASEVVVTYDGATPDLSLRLQAADTATFLQLVPGTSGGAFSVNATRYGNGAVTVTTPDGTTVPVPLTGVTGWTLRARVTGATNNLLDLWATPVGGSRSGYEYHILTQYDMGAGQSGAFGLANRSGGSVVVRAVRGGAVPAVTPFVDRFTTDQLATAYTTGVFASGTAAASIAVNTTSPGKLVFTGGNRAYAVAKTGEVTIADGLDAELVTASYTSTSQPRLVFGYDAGATTHFMLALSTSDGALNLYRYDGSNYALVTQWTGNTFGAAPTIRATIPAGSRVLTVTLNGTALGTTTTLPATYRGGFVGASVFTPTQSDTVAYDGLRVGAAGGLPAWPGGTP